MSFDVHIDCEKNKNFEPYRVTITGKDAAMFEDIMKASWVRGYKGESLVAAILSVARGGVSRVIRRRDNKLNDGAYNLPAVQIFNEKGKLAESQRYKNDKLNDGENGDAAIEKFFAERLILSERYQAGVRNDGVRGEPALKRYNGDGTLARVERYKNGLRNDGVRGEPAVQEFNDDGRLIRAIRYKDGKYVKEMSFDDIEGHNKKGPEDDNNNKPPKPPTF